MPRALDNLLGQPKTTIDIIEDLRNFKTCFYLVLTYGIDWRSEEIHRKAKDVFRNINEIPVNMEETLRSNFFNSLYINRPEENEIKRILVRQGPILVNGLVGAGKTTLLGKIKSDFSQDNTIIFEYFDLREKANDFRMITIDDFDQYMCKDLYFRLFNKYINSSNDDAWNFYKVMNDPIYSDFLEKVYVVLNSRINSIDDWRKAIKNQRVLELFLQVNKSPSLNTLIKFLNEQKYFILCFDNVDRYPIYIQKKMLSLSLDLSYSANISIIFTVRESNYKRLINEAKSESGDTSVLGDQIYNVYVDRLNLGEEPNIYVKSFDIDSIKTLLLNRLIFLQTNNVFIDIQNYINKFLKANNMDFNNFYNKFWNLFDNIAKKIIVEGIYELCNHNIREVLITYFNFIVSIMFNPEELYSLNNLLLVEDKIVNTRIHTYFYKWMICNGGIFPSYEGQLPNVFTDSDIELKFINYRILAYIHEWQYRFPNRRLKYERLISDFERLNVSKSLINLKIISMAKGHGLHELGLLSIDNGKSGRLSKDSIIELLPAGKYFVEKLATTREYAFWYALDTNLEVDITDTKKILWSDTYKDIFKFKIVYNHIERILIPWLESELNYFHKNLVCPKGWLKSNLKFLYQAFNINKESYTKRLLLSIFSTIEYSDLTIEDKGYCETKHKELFNRVVSIERNYEQ